MILHIPIAGWVKTGLYCDLLGAIVKAKAIEGTEPDLP